MPFTVIDPAANGGRAVLTFDSPHDATGLTTATVPVAGDESVKYLYLLHTSCWNQFPAGTVIGSIDILFADGSGVARDVRAGMEVADWWNPGDLDNGKVAVRRDAAAPTAGVYLSAFRLGAFAAPVRSVTFRTARKAIWIVVAATLSDREYALADTRLVFRDSPEWRAVDLSDTRIRTGSALDVSNRVGDRPAGAFGRLAVGADGAAVFADRPEEPARLNGFTYFGMRRLGGNDAAATAANIEEFAEQTRRQGYNLVRPLCLDMVLMDGSTEENVYNPEMVDRFDRLLAAFKKRGIYVYVTIGAYRLGRTDFSFAVDMDQKMRMYLADSDIRARWRKAAEFLFNHVNPHTGLALKDEPAVACVEFFNEIELGQRLGRLGADVSAALAERYRAWRTERGLPDAPLPEAMPVAATDDAANAFGLFLLERSRETAAWCEAVVRENGYPGLTSQFNCSPRVLDGVARWEASPVASYNSYFAHPSSREPGGRCAQDSSVGSQAAYVRNFASVRPADRPFFVTEHNHAFWNQYQREDGLLFGAYAALQGFDAVMVHSDPVELDIRDPNNDFSVARNPVARANEFVAGCLYGRGDVRRAAHRVELRVPETFWRTDGNGNRGLSLEQAKLALLTGFGVGFPGVRRPPELAEVRPASARLVFAPGRGAAIRAGDWSVEAQDGGTDGFALRDAVERLRRAGILTKDNVTDPAKGVFQSETGEIVLDAPGKRLRVVAPRSEGITLGTDGRAALPTLVDLATTVPATVALCSVDGRPLAESRRMVLVYSTEAANDGMELSGDRVTLRTFGGLPVLMRTGTLRVAWRRAAPERFRLYALALTGERRAEIPLARDGGTWRAVLDTAALERGPTPFFELVAEPEGAGQP